MGELAAMKTDLAHRVSSLLFVYLFFFVCVITAPALSSSTHGKPDGWMGQRSSSRSKTKKKTGHQEDGGKHPCLHWTLDGPFFVSIVRTGITSCCWEWALLKRQKTSVPLLRLCWEGTTPFNSRSIYEHNAQRASRLLAPMLQATGCGLHHDSKRIFCWRSSPLPRLLRVFLCHHCLAQCAPVHLQWC